MASKKEQLSPCFSLLESHIFLMESFSWVSQEPSPLKETQTVKKIFLKIIKSRVTTRGPLANNTHSAVIFFQWQHAKSGIMIVCGKPQDFLRHPRHTWAAMHFSAPVDQPEAFFILFYFVLFFWLWCAEKKLKTKSIKARGW